MKSLIVIMLITTFANFAFAESKFICGDRNPIAQLEISDSRVESGSYEECNGGVGDEMKGCKTHNYQIEVQDVSVAFKINEDTVSSQFKIGSSAKPFDVFKILVYDEYVIHLRITGEKNEPMLSLKLMAKGSAGKPVKVGDYLLRCL